jgi:prolyl-tRNA synthetase
VNYVRDYTGETADVRMVADGDACTKCGSALKLYRGIEGGHIFVLGTHYSAKMGATFLDESGASKPVVMGCYGIGVSRLVAAAIEQYNDENGIKWPMAIAPYQASVISLGKKGDEVSEAAEKIYEELLALGVEVLFDDREERPGVKFKDADLIGIPLRVTIGGRGLKEGVAELKSRDEAESKNVPIADIAGVVRDRVVALGGKLRSA